MGLKMTESTSTLLHAIKQFRQSWLSSHVFSLRKNKKPADSFIVCEHSQLL